MKKLCADCRHHASDATKDLLQDSLMNLGVCIRDEEITKDKNGKFRISGIRRSVFDERYNPDNLEDIARCKFLNLCGPEGKYWDPLE